MPPPRSIHSTPQPPDDAGTRLATIARGLDAELRITLVPATADRPAYIKIRAWSMPEGSDQLWPRPGRFAAIGLDEIPMVVEALASARGPVVAGLESLRGRTRAIRARSLPGGRDGPGGG